MLQSRIKQAAMCPEHQDFPPPALPERPEFAAWRAQRLADFHQRWQALPTLDPLATWAEDADFARWSAICYVEYEALYLKFCADSEDFCRLATLALGECLARHLGMRWCQSPLFPGEDLLLHHPQYPTRIRNLYALVVHRWLGQGSYELPQLFDDLLLEWRYTLPYPLDAVSTLPWREAKPVYRQRWGSAPSEALHQRLYRVFHADDESAVRFISGTVFQLPGNPPWRQLLYNIEVCEAQLDQRAEDCSRDWRACADAAYATAESVKYGNSHD
ncbi:hypothetical protein CO613_04725 [Lysobacteraceae bacterium NML07-0707]|nr:hypothetical protein CO613_04725 [Xanthomonadaceae bacterium NML07-0707]